MRCVEPNYYERNSGGFVEPSFAGVRQPAVLRFSLEIWCVEPIELTDIEVGDTPSWVEGKEGLDVKRGLECELH